MTPATGATGKGITPKDLAHAIVLGTMEPSSGWYNSPDDLEAVIARCIESYAETVRPGGAHAE